VEAKKYYAQYSISGMIYVNPLNLKKDLIPVCQKIRVLVPKLAVANLPRISV
jgi:hypothetical protein